MILGALVLWAGLPLGCLWVGSQVQASSGSFGLALFAMAVAFAVGVWLMLGALTWLNDQHIHAREARGLESYGNVTLEGVMAISAGVALVSFCIWFFLFSGSSPIPLNIGY